MDQIKCIIKLYFNIQTWGRLLEALEATANYEFCGAELRFSPYFQIHIAISILGH